MSKYGLVDSKGYITHMFEQDMDFDTETALAGTLYYCVGWVKDKEPVDYQFVCNLCIKWDGCSHFYFNGEEYNGTEEVDGYYHLCGGDIIFEFLVGIAFVVKLANDCIPGVKPDLAGFHHVLNTNLLDNFKIIKMEE